MFSSSYIVCSLRSAYYRPFSDFPQRMDGVRSAQLSVSLGKSRSYDRRFLRYDGSIPGPLPLICPSLRILSSCSALIKYRRVQTSLHRIIIRFESWLLSIKGAVLLLTFFHTFYVHWLSRMSEMHFYAMPAHSNPMGQNLCMPHQSQDTGASDRTM